MIRPPDPAIKGVTVRYMPIGSAAAVRRLVHLAFRDAHTALDLTVAHRGFWRDPLPPGLTVTSNNLDPAAATDLHVNFLATGLPDDAYDLVVYDPPHVPNAGQDSIMGRRFGTVRGLPALRQEIEAGAREAWRIARVGILVKVTDFSHESAFQQLTRWVEDAIPVRLLFDLHTFRAGYLRDGKHRAVRVPRSNGAVYLVFRKDGHKHRDFDWLYRRQSARAEKEAAT